MPRHIVSNAWSVLPNGNVKSAFRLPLDLIEENGKRRTFKKIAGTEAQASGAKRRKIWKYCGIVLAVFCCHGSGSSFI
jgi:hypothetical protein